MNSSSEASILYLEDEVLVALDMQDILKDMGFSDVTHASRLSAGEAAFREKSYDLAILDVNLGDGTTCIGLAHEIAAAGVPVIFTTGYNASELPSTLEGAYVLEKPVSPDRLKRQLAVALDRPASVAEAG